MARIRMIGLCLAAMLTMGGVAASTASAKVTFRSKSSLPYAERVDSCNVPKPTGVVIGDQMLMQVYVEDPEGNGAFTIASNGWKLLQEVDNKSSGVWFALAVFTKKYEASDPAEYPVTWSGTAKRGCGALAAAWSGVNKSEPINAYLGAASAGASTTVHGPSILTTRPNCMVVMLGDYNSPDTRMAPGGMTDIAGPEGVIAQVLQPEVGATGNKDAKTGHAEANVGFAVALNSGESETPPGPVVTNVSPNSGPAAGGTSVTITGTALNGASTVKFGASSASSFTVNSASSITATSPPGTGTVDVTLTTPGGVSSPTVADRFSYVAAPAKVTFRSKSSLPYAERVDSCNVPKPTGVVIGDQMLMQVYVEDPEGNGAFTIASNGWKLLQEVDNKSSGVWFALAVFTKKYEASDPAEYPVTWSGTAKRGCGALAAAWSGVNKSEPINAYLGAASAGASTTVHGPSILTTRPNCMVVMLGDYNSPDTRMAPGGMTDIAGPEGVIAQVLQPEVGATGNKDAKTGHAEANVGFAVALNSG